MTSTKSTKTIQPPPAQFQFAPYFTTETPSPTLQTAFSELNNRLRWENLSHELQKAETTDNKCYIRCRIQPPPPSGTFAGYPSGSPLKITRSNPQEKRAYFIRHYIRTTSETSKDKVLPTAARISHVGIGSDGEYVILKVDIDRVLDLGETFYSHDFGTWMFYVARIDCVLKGFDQVRIAFCIERTISPQERNYIESLNPGKLSHPTPRVKVGVSEAKVVEKEKGKIGGEKVGGGKVGGGKVMGVVGGGVGKSSSSGVSSGSVGKVVGKVGIGKGRSSGNSGNGKNGVLTLWEELDSVECYKPLFVCEDEAFDRKIGVSWVVPDPEVGKDTIEEYWRLRNMPGCRIPEWAEEDGRVVGGGHGDELEVDDNDGMGVLNAKMVKALKAAVDYNVALEAGRSHMKEWFVEDMKLEQVRKKEVKESDPESSSDT